MSQPSASSAMVDHFVRPSARPSDHERCLLLTATIAPPKAAVARNNVDDRVQDYRHALTLYGEMLRETFSKIVFVDNSGSSLAPVFEDLELPDSLSVEAMSFRGNDHPVSFGKAYGEFGLIEFALRHSKLIHEQTFIWKSTGRIVCKNLNELCQKTPESIDWICDLHNVPFVYSGKFTNRFAADLRCFGFRRQAFDEMLGDSRIELQQDFDAATVYEKVVDHLPNARIVPRFPVQPRYVGISGRTGRHYDGASQTMKDSAKDVARRVAPGLWL